MRKLILFIALSFLLGNQFLFSQVPSYVPTNGLVAYWPFSGNANDASGYGNNGTVNGATLTSDRFGNANSAYNFSSIGCATRIDAQVNTSTIQSGLTISIWVLKNGDGCIGPRILEFWPSNNPNGPGTAGWGWDNGLGVRPISIGSTTTGSGCYGVIPGSDVNVWLNVVYTNDGNFGKFYQNGVLISTISCTGNPILAGNVAFGRMNHPSYDSLNGKLDDIGIWNRALTPQEVSNLYTSCTTPAPTGALTQTFCATPAPTVASLTATGTGIQWYATATGGTALATTTALVNGTTYYASQTVSGCESTNRLAVTVTLNDPQITASATTLCSGTPVTLTASTTATVAQICNLPANLQTGLVGYWPFCGNANDLSGNGNNGTVNGAILTTDRFGNANSAYNFDGISNKIQTSNSSSISFTNDFTLSAWKYEENSNQDYHTIISKRLNGNWSYNLVISKILGGSNLEQNKVFTGRRNNGGAQTEYRFSNINTQQGNWEHILVTVSNNVINFYINGQNAGYVIGYNGNNGYVPFGNTFTIPMIDQSVGLTFGDNNDGGSEHFKGKIDDVAIYNRALSPSEIAQLYTATPTYLWSTGDTTATINPTPAATTTYWCDVTVNGVTCRKSVTITVNTPVAPTGALTQTFCATPTPTVASLAATGTGIQWYAAATGGTALATTTALVNGTTYYASQTVSGCESTARLAVTVTLNDPQITASATTVCSGTPVTLTASTTATVAQNCNLPANLQTGLVGYWPFCGNANDVSGNANNGTVNGSTLTSDRFGNANSAYSFDGVSNVITIQDNNVLHQNVFSISSWVNGNEFNGFKQILSKNIGSLNNESINLVINNNSNWNLTAQIGGQGYYGTLIKSPNSISQQLWHNIVYVYNETLHTQELYLNGIRVANNTSVDLIQYDNKPLTFGAQLEFNVLQYFFNGTLDDIGIWNRALSQSEITQLYTAVPPTYLWSTGETTATINPTPTATTTYWCDVTVNGVTCRKSVTVTVNTTPAPTGALTQTFCATPAPTVANLTATGTGIQWYAAATGGTALATTTALVNGTTYYASQTVSGCESTTRLAVTVSLNDPQITASATTICSGSPVTLSASTTATVAQNCNLPANLQTGLVGYWPFCGNANDVSGNANNGTVNGATLTTDRFGNTNSAYNFDGQSEISCSMNFVPSGNMNRTINLWINTNNISQFNKMLAGYGNDIPLEMFALIMYNPSALGKVAFWARDNDTPFPNTVNLNQWTMYSLTYNNNSVFLYENGIFVLSNNYSFIPLITPQSSIFHIGKFNNNVTGFNGKLDDISLWNRALSPSEIAQLYTATPTYLWSTGDTTATINPSPTATTTYWCDVTVNGVTCRKSVIITVNTPVAPTGALTQTFCATPTPTVASLAATGTGIQWYAAATGGTALATTTALANGTTYYASQTVSGCESTARLAVTVTLNDPQITASATTVCSGTAVNLSITGGSSSGAIGNTQTPNPWPNPSSFDAGIISLGQFGRPTIFSTSFWINPESTQNGISIILDCSHGGSSNWVLQSFGDNNYTWGNLTVSLSPNVWQHVLLTYNNGVKKCFVNGQLTATINQAINYSGIPNLNLGNWPEGGRRFNGKIDELYVTYNILETSNFIPLQTITNILPNTMGLWHFDEGSGSTSLNSNNSTNINIGSWYWTSRGQFSTSYLWSTGETTAAINPSPTTNTTYWCDVTVNGVTCRKSITINVNPNITPTFTQVAAICYGATAPTLSTNSIENITGTWSPAFNNTATTLYTFTPTAGLCATTATMTVTVNTTPVPTGNATQTFCATPAPTVASLTATGTGIQWYAAATGGTALATTTALVNGTTYYASQTVSGCESTTRLAVTVSLNDPQITASATTVCSGTQVSLTANNSSQNVSSCTGVSNYNFLDFTSIAPVGNYTNLIKKGNEFYLRSNNDVFKSINLTGPYSSLNFNSQIGINEAGQLLGFDNLNRLHISTSHNGLYLYDGINWSSNGLIGFGTAGQYFTKLANGRIVISKGGFLRDIYYSDDNGVTWINATNIDVDWNNIVIASNGDLYASSGIGGVNNKGVIKSTDNGSSWFYINSNLGIISSTGIFKDCVNNLFIVGDNKIFKSSNDGATWNVIANIPPIFTSFPSYGQFVVTSSGDFYYHGENYLFLSNNQGVTWTQITNIPGNFGTIREVDGNIVVCSTQGLYAKTLSNNTTFLWSTGETTAAINPSPTTNTTYWCDVTVNGVMCRKSITINVNPNITPTFTQVAAICYGAPAPTLPTNSIENITGTWSPAFNNTATTLYTFTPTAGLCATTATMTVTVNPIITPTFTQEADICYGATAPTLPTNSIENITGTWSPAFNNTATTLYTFTPDTGLCASTATMSVTVKPLPAPPTGVSVQTFCANIFPTLQSIIVNPSNVNWYSSSTSTTALPSTTYLPPGVTTYYASQYDSTTGCESNIRLAVSVNVLFENSPSTIEDQTYCSSDEKTIGDIITGGLNIVWYTTPNGGTPVSNSIIISSSSTLYAAIFNPITGCESPIRTKVEITIINCLLVSNNLLTINDNDLNDNLNIQNIENFPVNQIEIYNRLGELVWKTDYYNNADISFQGKANVSGVYQINSYLPTGTYYYILKYYDPYHIKYNEMKSFLYINNNN